MTRYSPSICGTNHRRAVAVALFGLTALLLIGNGAGASGCTADAYPIVVGSDEDTLLAPSARSLASDETSCPDPSATNELVDRLYDDVFNAADPDAAAALIADDAVIQTDFGVYLGPDGLLDYVAFVKRTYPDAAFEVTDVNVRGDTVEVAWVMTASRILFDPVELPLIADVEISGSTTINIDQLQVTELRTTNDTVLIDGSPTEIVGAP